MNQSITIISSMCAAAARFMAVAAVVALVAVLPSCGSKRNVAAAASPAEAPAAKVDAADVYATLAAGYSDWSDVYMPVRIELDAPMPFSMSGRATMVRDKSILISMRMLGIEVAALFIDGDKVYVADKYHRYLFADNLANLLDGYPLTVGDIQDVLLGRACYPGKGTLTAAMRKLFDMVAASGMTMLSPRSRDKGFEWHFDVSDDPVALSRLVVTPAGRSSVELSYGAAATTPAGQMATSVTASARLRAKELRANLIWNVGQARWNSGRTADWRVPEGYTPLSKDNIMNMLKF